jgi:hypothetical protein
VRDDHFRRPNRLQSRRYTDYRKGKLTGGDTFLNRRAFVGNAGIWFRMLNNQLIRNLGDGKVAKQLFLIVPRLGERNFETPLAVMPGLENVFVVDNDRMK